MPRKPKQVPATTGPKRRRQCYTLAPESLPRIAAIRERHTEIRSDARAIDLALRHYEESVLMPRNPL